MLTKIDGINFERHAKHDDLKGEHMDVANNFAPGKFSPALHLTMSHYSCVLFAEAYSLLVHHCNIRIQGSTQALRVSSFDN